METTNWTYGIFANFMEVERFIYGYLYDTGLQFGKPELQEDGRYRLEYENE